MFSQLADNTQQNGNQNTKIMKEYTIKAPGHYSNMPKGLLWNPTKCKFRFTIYPDQFEVGKDKFEQHKIVGFSRGFHHKNSFRLGFMYDGEYITFTAYIYKDGEKPYPNYKKILKVKVDRTELFVTASAGMPLVSLMAFRSYLMWYSPSGIG